MIPLQQITKVYPALTYGDHADLFLEDTRFTTIRWEDGKIEEINTGRDAGFGLRYLQDERHFFAHHNSLSVNDILATSHKLVHGLKKKNSSRTIEKNEVFKHPMVIDPSSVALEKKISLLHKLYNNITHVSSEILQVILYYGEKEKDTVIVTATSPSIGEQRTYCILMITVIAARNGILQTATELIGGIGGFELVDESTVLPKGIQTAQRALDKLSAPRAPVGEMPIVISAEAGGTMIHETVGHSLEADAIQKGISPVYSNKKNTLVASSLITVIDDPTLSGRRGSYAFDDEGIKSSPTVLIEHGVLKTYLYDIATARKDGVPSNAHGRRQSYRQRPIPRMSNTFIKSGTDNPREIINSISDGLLVKKMGGGQVNTATGDFVFEVEEGYRIQNGKIKELVRGANLLGNGPEVLKSIDRVGNDLGWGLGTCGKEGQGVPVSDAQPTLRIKKLLVGGG